MNNDEVNFNALEMPEPAKWVDDVLRLAFDPARSGGSKAEVAPLSEGFQRRCQAAAVLASNITRLRRERRRIGFVPISLAAYVRGLMKVADVQVAELFAQLGIEETSLLNSKSVDKLARFAHQLGIGLREFLIHLRIGFVERIDAVPVSLLLAHHRSVGIRDQLTECESVLGLLEAEYDTEQLNELRRAEFEGRLAYKQSE